MKEIEKFKTLIEKKEYFDAHEALEELWFPILDILPIAKARGFFPFLK